MQLGEKHLRCIDMIIEGYRITEIAERLPTSRQSIYNWLDDVSFKAELDKQRQEIKIQGKNKILNKLDAYIEKIQDIAFNSASDNVKLNALEFLVENVVGKATTKIEQTTKPKEDKQELGDLDTLIADIVEANNIIELNKKEREVI